MRASSPELVVDQLHFPECFRWRDDRLWFSDMFAGEVRTSTGEPGTGSALVLKVDGDDTGGLGWLPDGDLLTVSMKRRVILRTSDRTDSTRIHCDLSSFFPSPINDMYVDPSGRAYVTGFGYDVDNGAPVEGVKLALVEPSGSSRLVGSPLIFPNGIDLRNGNELVVAETFADCLSTQLLNFDGSLGERRVTARLDEGDGPDGICCDQSGGIWVACAFGEKAVHFDAHGHVDCEISVPGLGVFEVSLGGPDMRTLFIGVADHDEEYGAIHRTGSILAAKLDS